MKRNADWLAWSLQFIAGLVVGASKSDVTIEQQPGGIFPLQNIGTVRCFGLPD